ncbi:MAG: hypothetical protein J7480_04160 [Microbacteriaceae bacterium]|nr:hypothetical protein [Microbacteriaceae bacterium]
MDLDSGAFRLAPLLPPFLAPRERLLARLDDAAAHPLTIVRAIAGGGKTALLTQWVRGRDEPGFWMSVGESSGHRFAFWRQFLRLGLGTGAIPAGTALGGLVVGEETGDELRESLLLGLSALPRPLLVVVDDYQHVTDPAVHDDLHALLVAGVPLRIILLTRAATPLEEPERAARLRTTVLGPAELPFTAEEVVEVAAAHGLDEEAARGLHGAFDGWPLPTRTALAEFDSGRSMTLPDAIERVRHSGIRQALAAADDGPFLLFLLRVSIAVRLTAPLAAELSMDDPEGHLARAEQEGLGGRADDDAGEFVLQPLVRALLWDELLRRLPHEVPRLRAVYARERAAAGDPVTAMRQHAALGDWPALLPVVKQHYSSIVSVFRAETLEILESAPDVELRRQPLLLLLIALLRNSEDKARRGSLPSLIRLGLSMASARLGRGDPVDRAWLLSGMMAAQRVGGHYPQAYETAQKLVTLLRSFGREQREELRDMLAGFWLQIAWSSFFVDRDEQIPELIDSALEAARAGGAPWIDVHAVSMQLLLAAMDGAHDVLLPRLEAARARERPLNWRGKYSSSGYHYAEALVALESFDAAGARAEIDALAVHEHSIEHWPVIARIRGLAALVDGEAFEGLRRLKQDVAAHEDRPLPSRRMQSLLSLTEVDLLLAAGETVRAERGLSSKRRAPAPPLGAARVALAAERTERAVALASAVAWSELPQPRRQAEALLVLGTAALRSGHEQDARIAADRALDLLAAHRLRRPLMMLPRADVSALIRLVGEDPGAMLAGVPDVFPASSPTVRLSERERRVLAELVQFPRVDDLAGALYVSPNTVKSQLRSIYRKLGVASREEAITVAHLRGFLDPPDRAA